MATRWNCAWVNFGLTEQRRRRSTRALGMSPTQAPASHSKRFLPCFCLMAVPGTGWQQGAEGHGEELQASLTPALASEPPSLQLHLASLTQFVITLASSFTQLFTPCWSNNLLWNPWLDFEGSKVVLQRRKFVVCLLLKAFSPKSFLGQLSHFIYHTAWPGLQWAAVRDTESLTTFGFISKVSALCWCCQSCHTVL